MIELFSTKASHSVPYLTRSLGPAVIISIRKGMANRTGVVATHQPATDQWVTHEGTVIDQDDLQGRVWLYLDQEPQENGDIGTQVLVEQYHFLTVYLTKTLSVRSAASSGPRKFSVWRALDSDQRLAAPYRLADTRFAYAHTLDSALQQLI